MGRESATRQNASKWRPIKNGDLSNQSVRREASGNLEFFSRFMKPLPTWRNPIKILIGMCRWNVAQVSRLLTSRLDELTIGRDNSTALNCDFAVL